MPKRKQHHNNTGQYDRLSHTDHLSVIQFHCNESIDSPANGNSNAKHPGKGSSCFGIDPLCQIQITACPEHGCLLYCTITEETDHNRFCSGNPNNFLQRKNLSSHCFFRGCLLLLPFRKTKYQNRRKYNLQYGNNTIPCVPGGTTRKSCPQKGIRQPQTNKRQINNS